MLFRSADARAKRLSLTPAGEDIARKTGAVQSAVDSGEKIGELVEIRTGIAAGDKLVTLGVDLAPGTPQQFGDYVRSEIAKWRGIIKVANISEP